MRHRNRYQTRVVLKSGYLIDTLPSAGEWVLYMAADRRPYLAVAYFDDFLPPSEREFAARKLYERVRVDLLRDGQTSGTPMTMAAIDIHHPLTHFPGTVITNHRDFSR